MTKADGLLGLASRAGQIILGADLALREIKGGRAAAVLLGMDGDLSPAQILAARSAEEVYLISKELCQQMKPFGGFILAPGCDLAPNIPLENLQAMAKAARQI